MSERSVGVISLGCSKNRVDSEIMLQELMDNGWQITQNPQTADVVIINTCGFILSAQQEAVDTILEMAQYKQTGNCRALLVTGCLSQRFSNQLAQDMPEIDGMLGINQYGAICRAVDETLRGNRPIWVEEEHPLPITGTRILTTPPYMAYVRIADGCDNFCSYCAIPKIRGRYRSRTMEDILQELTQLSARGVQEAVLIAQDTTRYGMDLYGEPHLLELLRQCVQVPGIRWVRVLYCYPELITKPLLDFIMENEKMCKYLDVPIQHIDDTLLKDMNRRSTTQDIYNLVAATRAYNHPLALRTSLIVGYPGESEQAFDDLCSFIGGGVFLHAGVFAYSKEDGTAAAKKKGQIPQSIKRRRANQLMQVQQGATQQLYAQLIGRTEWVLVEGQSGHTSYGRLQYQAPEVDGKIYLNQLLPAGQFVQAKITGCIGYDVTGEVV